MIKFNMTLTTRREHFGEFGVYTHGQILIAWCDTKEKAEKVKEDLIKWMKEREEE